MCANAGVYGYMSVCVYIYRCVCGWVDVFMRGCAGVRVCVCECACVWVCGCVDARMR